MQHPYAALAPEYAALLAAMRVNPDRVDSLNARAGQVLDLAHQHRQEWTEVEGQTGVPQGGRSLARCHPFSTIGAGQIASVALEQSCSDRDHCGNQYDNDLTVDHLSLGPLSGPIAFANVAPICGGPWAVDYQGGALRRLSLAGAAGSTTQPLDRQRSRIAFPGELRTERAKELREAVEVSGVH